MTKKNVFRYLGALFLASILFTSCLKDDKFLDVSNTQTIVEFAVGTPATSVSSWGTLPDTAVLDTAIAINIASPQVLNYDITVNIKTDVSMITNYNTANPKNLLLALPDSCYDLLDSTVTIPAGYRIGKLRVKLYPQKINPVISYAMPFAIASTSQSGVAPIISNNAGYLLYAFIGNPIAGNYSDNWRRWSNSDNSGTPSYNITDVAIFSPKTPTEVSMESPMNGLIYLINFENNGSVLSNFSVSIDPNSFSAAGVDALGGTPKIVVSSDYKTFTISFNYTLSSGAARSVIDIFTKQ